LSYVFTLAEIFISATLSTTKVEYIVVSHACKEEIWLKGLLGEIGRIHNKLTMFYDSQSVIHLSTNPFYHGNTILI